MVPASVIRNIKTALPIDGVIREYVGGLRTVPGGFIALCPFHKENTPSFRVHVSNALAGTWKCFGCGASGDIFTFVQKTEGWTFAKTVKYLGERAGFPVEGRNVSRAFCVDESNLLRMFPWWVGRRQVLARRLLDQELADGPPATRESYEFACSLGRLMRREWTFREFRNVVTFKEQKEWDRYLEDEKQFADTWLAPAAEVKAD